MNRSLIKRKIEQSLRFFSSTRASPTIFFCVPGKEFILTQELGHKLDISSSNVQILKPGIIQVPEIQSDIPDLVFSLQVLRNGQFHTTPKEVELTFSRSHIVTHSIVPKMMKGAFSRSAANNRSENILKTLTKFHAADGRKFLSPRQLSWYKGVDFQLLQVLSFDRDNFFVSLSSPSQLLLNYSHWPSLSTAGLNDIHYSLPTSPNSAFRKLSYRKLSIFSENFQSLVIKSSISEVLLEDLPLCLCRMVQKCTVLIRENSSIVTTD